MTASHDAWSGSRQGYRSLWLPPDRRPERQALGRPYVWDGRANGWDGDGDVRDADVRDADADASDGADSLLGQLASRERAVIGDELREIAAWCQIAPCIARYTDAAATGEADIRIRAAASGWCVDLFDRLVCPACQQRLPIWSARPVVPRDAARPGRITR